MGVVAFTTMPDRSLDKATLRREARARRDATTAEERARAAAAVTARVDAEILAALPAGATIGLYAAMRSELPTAAIARAAAARGLVVAFPRTSGADHVLAFHRAVPDELAVGRFGIPEPRADAPRVDLADLDVVLVPGLLFDRHGYRLGWGGGWYDATLVRTTARRVGLAFEHQVVDELPRAPHDQPVHLIATDAGLHAGAQGP